MKLYLQTYLSVACRSCVLYHIEIPKLNILVGTAGDKTTLIRPNLK